MKINKNIPLLIKIYLLSVSIFSSFRLILFFTEIDRINFTQVSIFTILQSFIMGIRFDIVISGYILFIPAVALLSLDIFQSKNKYVYKVIFYWIFIFFSIAFFVAAADIPYFNQFFERFSIGAFEWFNHLGFVISMIIQEPTYFLIIIPFLLLDTLFYFLLKKFFSQKAVPQRPKFLPNIIFSLLFLFLMFVGIRGRVQKKSPIRVGTAYFCDNVFLNKLGLNPVFTLMRSYLDSRDVRNKTVHLMDNNTAIKKIREYLNIKDTTYNSPIARNIIPDTLSTKRPNVIIIIMESMSAGKMGFFGNKQNLTPFLDSLTHKSLFFENFYAAGKHTFNGIFSTLFSFPALYRQHTMNHIRKYDGIASILLKDGYSTTYFTTHDSQFDNVEGFLRANSFENIISQSDYPISEVKTTLGVPDDFMFRYSIPVIHKLANKDKPFFVTFMTASDHGPYYVPKYFKPENKKIKEQIVEYADWSLDKFITLASKEKWFNNTIFVFVADHGAPIDPQYEIALNYFHIPLIIYAPKIFQKNKIFKKTGSQIDIFPTIMGLLKLPYINNTLGINLLKENRKYAILNADDKIGIIDTSYFCIMQDYGKKIALYKYRKKDKKNYFNEDKEKAIDMVNFAKVNLQVTQEMIINKQTTLHKNQRSDGR